MTVSPACPVCGADQWQQVQTFTYYREDHEKRTSPFALFLRRAADYGRILLHNAPRPQKVSVRALTGKERRLRQTLFDTWFKGKDCGELTSVLCGSCGFMCYTPRPTNEDLRQKYRYYSAQGWDIGGQTGHSEAALANDARRAVRIFELAAGTASPGSLSVLDYGGGNGKLLAPFLAHGHRCSIVDYSNDTLPGIAKIADDIDGISTTERFDLIIISHVLEHLAEPRELLSRLRPFLAEGGKLYAEVPMEVWAGIRIGPDPITHVNYFSPGSFSALLRNAGLEPVMQETGPGSYGASRLLVSWILAERGEGDERAHGAPLPPEAAVQGDSEGYTLDDLRPGRGYSLRRILQLTLLPKLASFLARGKRR